MPLRARFCRRARVAESLPLHQLHQAAKWHERDDGAVSNPLIIISTDQDGLRTVHQWSSYAELAAAYWSEQKTWQEHDGGLGPAVTPAIEFVSDVTLGHAVDGWEVVRALLEAAPDDDAVEFVGAGPMEDLIVDPRSTAQLLDAVGALSTTSARCRQALAHVWVGSRDDLDEAQRARLIELGARSISIGPPPRSDYDDERMPEDDAYP